MRVLLIMDPLIPVPPRHYGGIERVIADLADDRADRLDVHPRGDLWEDSAVLAVDVDLRRDDV